MEVQTLCKQLDDLTHERDSLATQLAECSREVVDLRVRNEAAERELDKLRTELAKTKAKAASDMKDNYQARVEGAHALDCLHALGKYLSRPREKDETIDAWWGRLNATLVHDHFPGLYANRHPCNNPHCAPRDKLLLLEMEGEASRKKLEYAERDRDSECARLTDELQQWKDKAASYRDTAVGLQSRLDTLIAVAHASITALAGGRA